MYTTSFHLRASNVDIEVYHVLKYPLFEVFRFSWLDKFVAYTIEVAAILEAVTHFVVTKVAVGELADTWCWCYPLHNDLSFATGGKRGKDKY